MSPTGSPDFGAQPSGSSVSPTFDNGDISNRLLMAGGNMSRSGRWFWATGFENGAITDFATGGTIPTVKNSPPNWQGNYVLELKTLAVLGDSSSIFKYFVGAQSLGKWGIESMVAHGYLSSSMFFTIGTGSPTVKRRCQIRIKSGAAYNDVKVDYLDAAGVFQPVVDLGVRWALSASIWHNVKVVMDIQKLEYSRVYIDGTVYDLSGIPAGDDPAGFPAYERQYFQIAAKTDTAGLVVSLLDNVILTADEP